MKKNQLLHPHLKLEKEDNNIKISVKKTCNRNKLGYAPQNYPVEYGIQCIKNYLKSKRMIKAMNVLSAIENYVRVNSNVPRNQLLKTGKIKLEYLTQLLEQE